ncbi:MAG: tetratricopeptide repeat protein [Candidatus Bathyarchaeia archaeon]
MERLGLLLPNLSEPLAEIRIYVDGKDLLLVKDNLKFTPEGQLLIEFSPKKGSLIPLASDRVEELFFEALKCEEEGRFEEAKVRYMKVIELKPDHTDALVNMGNLFFIKGLKQEAERLYRKALLIDPKHVEANYNLAYTFEENGRLEDAALFYRRAIEEDPSFADACFNMASVLHRLGEKKAAKEFWVRYLELEPDGESSDLIRKYLEQEEE